MRLQSGTGRKSTEIKLRVRAAGEANTMPCQGGSDNDEFEYLGEKKNSRRGRGACYARS